MDLDKLVFAFDYICSSGVTFSVEERVGLQASLTSLHKDNQFAQVQFWGRIEGIENDYYIACGIGKDYINDRVYFYSMNKGLDWILLPPPTDIMKELGVVTKGRFIGDPTADAETECPAGGSDEVDENGQWIFMKEEERLSATVDAITREAGIVPRGALFKSPTGIISENRMFNGLNSNEASQFHSYYHLTNPKNVWDKNIVIRADYNLTLDFLDSISQDCPLGCWSIHIQKNEKLSLIRSLYWPGAFGFHVLNTPQYGWFYNGTGRKNWDVPFMISPVSQQARASIPEVYPLYAEDAGEVDGGGGDTMAYAKRQYSYGGRNAGLAISTV